MTIIKGIKTAAAPMMNQGMKPVRETLFSWEIAYHMDIFYANG
jgi:hypothetical protein